MDLLGVSFDKLFDKLSFIYRILLIFCMYSHIGESCI